MKPIVEAFEEVVNDVNCFLNIGKTVNYKHGHLLEINNTLVNEGKMSKTALLKYPLIMLLQPFDETVNDIAVGTSLRIIICTSTDGESKSKSRYEKTFKPVLLPIYNQLLSSLAYSKYFNWEGNLEKPPHTKTDRPFIGVGSENKRLKYFMNDKLDAIEIKDLQLNYYDNKC